jgi:hypothetical protein
MFESLAEIRWIGAALWAVLYISDYALTLACARMYQAQSSIVFEGSYELTPVFQADVDALRKVSPRFVVALIASTAYVWLLGLIAASSSAFFDLYVSALGALLLTEATVHMRHLRNWFIFSKGTGFIQGRLSYSRGFLLRLSAFELVTFAALYFTLYLVTRSMFVLGGALACIVIAINHYRMARGHHAIGSAAASSVALKPAADISVMDR